MLNQLESSSQSSELNALQEICSSAARAGAYKARSVLSGSDGRTTCLEQDGCCHLDSTIASES